MVIDWSSIEFGTILTSSLSSTAIVGLVTWLSRNLILTRLKSAVAHVYDKKLEDMRIGAKRSEQHLQAQLDTRNQQLELLRNDVMSRMGERRERLLRKEIEAIEELWYEVLSYQPAKDIANYIKMLNFEEALKSSEDDQETRKVWADILSSREFIRNKKAQNLASNPSKLRLHIPDLIWSLYSSYVSILMVPVLQATLLEHGWNKPGIVKASNILDLAKAALPEHGDYINEYGISGVYNLIDTLEEKVLFEMRSHISGETQTAGDIDKANRLLELVNSSNQSIEDSRREVEKQVFSK